jgi:hypothetical protein
LTIAENGAVRVLLLLRGEISVPSTEAGTTADADTVKSELRIEPRTVRFNLDDTDIATQRRGESLTGHPGRSEWSRYAAGHMSGPVALSRGQRRNRCFWSMELSR